MSLATPLPHPMWSFSTTQGSGDLGLPASSNQIQPGTRDPSTQMQVRGRWEIPKAPLLPVSPPSHQVTAAAQSRWKANSFTTRLSAVTKVIDQRFRSSVPLRITCKHLGSPAGESAERPALSHTLQAGHQPTQHCTVRPLPSEKMLVVGAS